MIKFVFICGTIAQATACAFPFLYSFFFFLFAVSLSSSLFPSLASFPLLFFLYIVSLLFFTISISESKSASNPCSICSFFFCCLHLMSFLGCHPMHIHNPQLIYGLFHSSFYPCPVWKQVPLICHTDIPADAC